EESHPDAERKEGGEAVQERVQTREICLGRLGRAPQKPCTGGMVMRCQRSITCASGECGMVLCMRKPVGRAMLLFVADSAPLATPGPLPTLGHYVDNNSTPT